MLVVILDDAEAHMQVLVCVLRTYIYGAVRTAYIDPRNKHPLVSARPFLGGSPYVSLTHEVHAMAVVASGVYSARLCTYARYEPIVYLVGRHVRHNEAVDRGVTR